jgi:hypothetical protein
MRTRFGEKQTGERQKNEREVMAKDKLTGRVSYRLGGQVFRQVERLAAAQDISANEWCRQVVIEKLKGQSQATTRAETGPGQAARGEASQGQAVNRGEQILLEEILRTRYLFHNTIYHYLRTNKSGLSLEMFEHIVNQSNERAFQEWLEEWQRSRRWMKPAS